MTYEIDKWNQYISESFTTFLVVRSCIIFIILQIATSSDTMLEVDSELADALEDIKEYTGTSSLLQATGGFHCHAIQK